MNIYYIIYLIFNYVVALLGTTQVSMQEVQGSSPGRVNLYYFQHDSLIKNLRSFCFQRRKKNGLDVFSIRSACVLADHYSQNFANRHRKNLYDALFSIFI